MTSKEPRNAKGNEMTTAQLISTLTSLKERNYTAAGNPNPKVAAAYAVTDILNTYRTQPQYLDQLLSEEIEDASAA